MLNHPPNWVAEHAECKIDLLYDALCQVVERDVAEANKLPPDLRGGFTYSMERNGEGTMPLLRVYRSREGKPAGPAQPVATFSQSQASIHVTAETGTFLARPEWVDQTRSCLLSIGGTRCKVWELSQRVLGPLFQVDPIIGCRRPDKPKSPFWPQSHFGMPSGTPPRT